MNDNEKRMIAKLRGEALGAHVLAAAALRAIFGMAANKMDVLNGMSAFIDISLNESGPAKGDTNDALNTLMRETARDLAMQTLHSIEGLLRNPPSRG